MYEISLKEKLEGVGCPMLVAPKNIEIEWASSPIDIYEKLFYGSKDSFWLDGELSSEFGSRFSIMGNCDMDAAISFMYYVQDSRLDITGPKGQESVYGDFYEVMDCIFSLITNEMPKEVLHPFNGGVIGYLGYELKALRGIQNKHSSDLPDAVLYLPKNIVVFDHRDQKRYVCNLWGEILTVSEALLQKSEESIQRKTVQFLIPPTEDEIDLEISSDDYKDKIKQCQTYITEGESYEICLTNRASMPYSFDPLLLYKEMRLLSPVRYSAFFNTERFSIVSSSPEMFISIDENGKMASKPIKGTRARGTTEEQDRLEKESLMTSSKDRAENLMIVDLVRHDFNEVCHPDTVSVPEAFVVETYSSVHQLVSTVVGELNWDNGIFKSIGKCFPGGSMTGAPKLRTMRIIDELEESPRGIYSGSIGWVGFNGYTDLSIVIRTVVIKDHVATFGVGGAIIEASDAEEEFRETLIKACVPFQSIRRVQKNNET